MRNPPDLPALDDFEASLPVGEMMTMLADPVARYTIYRLEGGSTQSLDRQADVVTGWIHAATGTVATRSDRDGIRIYLYHVALPMLDSVDIVRFDPVTPSVRTSERSPVLEAFIEWVRRIDPAVRDGP